jgi:hypothetical protein
MKNMIAENKRFIHIKKIPQAWVVLMELHTKYIEEALLINRRKLAKSNQNLTT